MLVYVIAVSCEGGKQMKRFTLLFLTLILLVSLSGCPYPWVYANHPCNKYDTTWSTADGKSAFYIPEDTPNATGIIRTNRGSVFFYYYDDPVDSHVYLDRKDDPDMAESEYHMSRIEDHFETWKAISVRPGKYTVRVEETTYFTPRGNSNLLLRRWQPFRRPGISASGDREDSAGGEKIPMDRAGYLCRCGADCGCDCCASLA